MAKDKKLDPVNIDLPEGVLLPNGTMSVSLPTLEALEAFWQANKSRLPYSCAGNDTGHEPMFMHPYQWVFGATKAAVIETVLRLGHSRIRTEFYNWKESSPHEWDGFFDFQDEAREKEMRAGTWTSTDEAKWAARTRESYHGWWRFTDVPAGMDEDNWFSLSSDAIELYNPSMTIAAVNAQLCEDTFEEWRIKDFWELETHIPASFEEDLEYWKSERAAGEDYYGCENEA